MTASAETPLKSSFPEMNTDGRVISETRRFLQLTCGIWVAMCVGCTYAFGILSNHMKSKYDLNQEDMTTITTVGYVFAFFSFPGGVIFDYYGPRLVLVLAALISATGFGLFALTFNGRLSHSVPMLSVELAMMTWGTGWMDIGSLMTNLFNFPLNRGEVITLQKTFMGLGSTVLALTYEGYFKGQYTAYCVFVMLQVLILVLIGAYFITFPPYHMLDREVAVASEDKKMEAAMWLKVYERTPAPMWRFRVGNIILAVILVTMVSSSVTEAYSNQSSATKAFLATLAIALVMSFTIMFLINTDPVAPIAALFPGKQKKSNSGSSKLPSGTASSATISNGGKNEELQRDTDDENEKKEEQEEKRDEDVQSPMRLVEAEDNNLQTEDAQLVEQASHVQFDRTFYESLQKPLLWLMWWASFCVWGTGVIVVANSAQIYRALNGDKYESETNALYVALIGVGSALGRIGIGVLESYRFGVMSLYVAAPVIMIAGMLMFVVLPASMQWLPFTLSSVGYGWSWGATILAARLMYSKDVGKHYNVNFTGVMLAMILLNRFLFGDLYDKESRRQGLYPHCAGTRCISTATWVLIGLNVTAVVSSWFARRLWLGHQAAARAGAVAVDGAINVDAEYHE